MPANGFRFLPPYEGDKPYLYLCFHPADVRMAKPVLKALVERRCRVWYGAGETLDANENKKIAAQQKNAELMVFLLTDRAAHDESMKSELGYFQTTERPVICIDMLTNAAKSGYNLIIKKNTRVVACDSGSSAEELVLTLMRTEGFTQRLMTDNDNEWQKYLANQKSRRIALTILCAAAVLLGCAIWYAQSNDWFRPEVVITDTVTISDPQIARAARFALAPDGKAALTPESLSSITVLKIEAPPASFDELSQFPALKRLEIPQSCVKLASALLDDATYEIVVYPEGDA